MRRARYWLPLLAACLCLAVATMLSPLLMFVLVMVAFGLFLDVATALFAAAGGTGGLRDNRQ